MVLEIENWKNLSYSQKIKCRESTPVDCSFIVQEGLNTRTIGAHKYILACASGVFQSMFNGSYKEADASFNIPLPNVANYVDFIVMLEYIYYTKTDSIELLKLERLKHVAYLADYYLLDPLLNACHMKIEKIVTENNTSFYGFLQIFEYEKKIRRMIDAFKADNVIFNYANIRNSFPYTPEVLLRSSAIYDLETSYFYDLLIVLSTVLRESDRFLLIENYAKINDLKMDMSLFNYVKSNNSESVNPGTPYNGKSLKEMFELIHFEKMTVSEFTDGPAVSKVWLVTPEEKFLILDTLVTYNVDDDEGSD